MVGRYRIAGSAYQRQDGGWHWQLARPSVWSGQCLERPVSGAASVWNGQCLERPVSGADPSAHLRDDCMRRAREGVADAEWNEEGLRSRGW